MISTYTIIGIVVLYILMGLKVVSEYERGVRFTLGKYSGMMMPGLRIVFPIFQTWQRVDIRTKAIDIPEQEAITKDNISVRVNAVLYFKVEDAKAAIIQVEHFGYAVSQLAQTTMRNAVGEITLDELLANREDVSHRIQAILDKATSAWGIDVSGVDLKDIELPNEMKRVIAQGAEAEREKRAVIIKAEGEVKAADNMAKAAKTLSGSPGALHLRTLQSLNEISSDPSTKIIFAVPLEVLRAFEGKGKK